MTVQAADSFSIEGKTFWLIDVEAGKQIIDCADFGIKIDESLLALSTGCYRGYVADYSVEQDILYGVKRVEISRRIMPIENIRNRSMNNYHRNNRFVAIRGNIGQQRRGGYYYDPFSYTIESEKTPIKYTGSCIIAGQGGGWNTDFIECYLYYNEAYELYYSDGLLVETRSLKSAINKFRNEENANINKDEVDPSQRSQLREDIAHSPLKYAYECSTYKWRNNPDW